MRIIAVTEYESVAVGLSLRSRGDHEVTTVRSVDELAEREWGTFDVALVALTTASRGLVAAAVLHEHLGPIPCVVVARTVPDELPDGIHVLTSPVDIPEIERALRRVMRAVMDTVQPDRVESRSSVRDDEQDRNRDDAPRGNAVIDPTPMPRIEDPGEPDPAEHLLLRDSSELREGLEAAERLQRLLDARPSVNDRHITAGQIVEDVRRSLDARSVVLWTPDGHGGFEALASHGVPVTVLEQGPSRDQPLLRSLNDEHDVVVETRGDRFSEHVADLPGLRGDSVIAGSLTAGGEVHGVLVVGGDGYTPRHARAIGAMLEHHALALAVATHLEVMRRRPAIDLSEPTHPTRPSEGVSTEVRP